MVHRRQSTALHFEPFHYSIATASHKILSSISSEKPWATRRIVMRFELSLRTEQTGSVTAHVYLYEQRERFGRVCFGGFGLRVAVKGRVWGGGYPKPSTRDPSTVSQLATSTPDSSVRSISTLSFLKLLTALVASKLRASENHPPPPNPRPYLPNRGFPKP